ncbi:MAG: hypothetical protein AAF514_17010, partial [Verrucomicrobiota bacterium]
GNWMIYRLSEAPPALLMANLEGLRRNHARSLPFHRDQKMRERVLRKMREDKSDCPRMVCL